ncbi:hypothetical protein SALBM217S_00574 [Streptomyces griseoloalbus]
MRDNAASVFAADPDANTVFSIHMYGVFDTAAEVSDYLGRFVAAELPIVVGESGHDHSDGNPDEDAVLSVTRQLGIGYLGWSWSGNGGGVEYLDMVEDFDPDRMTGWGQRLFDGPGRDRGHVRGGRRLRERPGRGHHGADRSGRPGGLRRDLVLRDPHLGRGHRRGRGDRLRRRAGARRCGSAGLGAAPVTVSGLAADTSYTFAVRARTGRQPFGTFGDGGRHRTGSRGRVLRGRLPGDGRVARRLPGRGRRPQHGERGGRRVDVALDLPAGQRIAGLWGGTATQSGAEVSVAAASYTATIPPSGSVSLGFTGTRFAAGADPTTFSLNGAECSAA